MNRFEKVAAKITTKHGVHVEWAPVNREYVVEGGRYFSTAKQAERFAAAVNVAANRSVGYIPSSSVIL